MDVHIPANERLVYFGPKLINTGHSSLLVNASEQVTDGTSRNICGTGVVIYRFPAPNATADVGVMEIVSVRTNPSDPSAGTSYTYQNPPAYERIYTILLLGH